MGAIYTHRMLYVPCALKDITSVSLTELYPVITVNDIECALLVDETNTLSALGDGIGPFR